VNALKPESEGGYGWTHWDNCIGEPAGYLPPADAELAAKKVCSAGVLECWSASDVEPGQVVNDCSCVVWR